MHLTAAKVIHFNSKGFVISPRTTRRLPKGTSSSKPLLWIFRSAYHKTTQQSLSYICEVENVEIDAPLKSIRTREILFD